MSDRIVEEMQKAYEAELCKPVFSECPRCKGKGYHHGFG